mmetsp:Transcript_35405/g.46606  ORF Transcript_35405/g.46606 Transcript_35405/m.46606 type:complete len:138 (-) Transcript_35405:614-1027(-)
MISPGNGPEVGHALPNVTDNDLGLSIVANIIEVAGPDSDRDVLDRSQVDQGCLGLPLRVVGSELLKAVLENVLGPVKIGLDGDGLSTCVASRVLADLLVEVIANGFLVLFPVRATKYVDAVVLEMEQTLAIDALSLI